MKFMYLIPFKCSYTYSLFIFLSLIELYKSRILFKKMNTGRDNKYLVYKVWEDCIFISFDFEYILVGECKYCLIGEWQKGYVY